MNEFLDRIKSVLKSDPSLIHGDLFDFLYTQLISFNLGKKTEPFKDIRNLFGDWIIASKSINNLETFVSFKNPYFCQFVNKNARNIAKEAIKLYIPMDENHLYEGVRRLFKFIAENNIEHNSKVAREIRNDCVVVRVSNLEEAEKVISFVGSDPYIQNALLNTNPFTINVNGVGIAKDGLYSYNEQLCTNLGRFISILEEKDRLDDLNMSTFHEYLEQIKDYGNDDLRIIGSLQSAVTSGKSLNFNDFKNIISNTKEKDLSKEDVLKNAIVTTANKYGIPHTVRALARFRYNGDASGFTRDNGVRIELQSKVSIDDVNEIIANIKIDSNDFLYDYVTSLVSQKKETGALYDYIVNAYNDTLIRYNKQQADMAIYKFVIENNCYYFTNSNGARDYLKNIDYSNIEDILRENLGIDSFCTKEDLVNEFINEMNYDNVRNL